MEKIKSCPEVWKNIVGYEGLYQVSNKGRVYSFGVDFIKNNKKRHFVKSGVLKATTTHDGYLRVRLYKNKKGKDIRIHRLVADAFVENDDSKRKIIVNHINGDKADNNAENLEWCTYTDNAIHAFEIGLRKPPNANANGNSQGEKVHNSKLNDEKVKFIRKNARINGGIYSNSQLAKKLNVCTTTIWQVINKKTWNHVK
ncbi:NUMOD4 domain-containing protein [Oceanobacillus sp. FSL W8-0428]|uniref:NUMOD4 domain-containing protein n=1 Tax=Oceanobacillus sp. FSL W8-0428 TaxID=2921715 RepID=UPI0030F4CA4C